MDARSRLAALGLAVALSVPLAACSSDTELDSRSASFDLTRDDPLGFTACRDVHAADATQDDAERDSLLESAAAAAAGAESAPLRETVSPPVDVQDRGQRDRDLGTYSVDPDELKDACAEVGFDPALVEED